MTRHYSVVRSVLRICDLSRKLDDGLWAVGWPQSKAIFMEEVDMLTWSRMSYGVTQTHPSHMAVPQRLSRDVAQFFAWQIQFPVAKSPLADCNFHWPIAILIP